MKNRNQKNTTVEKTGNTRVFKFNRSLGVIAFAIALVMFNTAFSQKDELLKSKDITVLNSTAKSLMEKPETQPKALQLLKRAESVKPNFETSMLLGDLYAKMGDGGKAISNYESAASHDPKSGEPQYKIGNVYQRSTNVDMALDHYNKSVTTDPKLALAWKEIGEMQYAKKNGAEAVKAQEQYISLVHASDEDVVRMAFYYFMAKDFTKAGETFKKAYDRGAVQGTALRYYALTLNEQNDLVLGQKIFDEYLQQAKPETVSASDYALYAKMLTESKQDSLAIIAIDKSLAIDSTQITLRQTKAEALYKGKRYTEAVAAYDKLMASRTKPAASDLFGLGRSLYYSENYQRADTTFRKLIEAQPTVAPVYLWAARTNANLDPESTAGLAKPFYEKVIELGQATPDKSKADLKEAYQYLGYYHLLKKEIALSKANWEKVLVIDPQNEQAQNALKLIKKG